MNKEKLKNKIAEIIFEYENKLAKAGANFENIDYDLVANARTETWDKILYLITT